MPAPDRITFYFDLNGKPQTKPVDFVLRCSGYDPPAEGWTGEDFENRLDDDPCQAIVEPDSYEVEEVYTLD